MISNVTVLVGKEGMCILEEFHAISSCSYPQACWHIKATSANSSSLGPLWSHNISHPLEFLGIQTLGLHSEAWFEFKVGEHIQVWETLF